MRRRPHRSTLALDGDDGGWLAGGPRRIGEVLRDHLLAPERDDHDGADIGVAAVGRERFVRQPAIGPELAAAGEMRKRRAVSAPIAPAIRSATTDAQITVGTTST